MKKIIILLALFTGTLSFAQVRMTSTAISSVNSSAFIDASSQPSNNSSVGTGKGLVFPRVDLSTFAFVAGITGQNTNFPGRYDGMIVYNTKDGGTANAGTTQGTLTPGFWFYENKSTTVAGGTWKPLGSSAATANNVLAVSTATYTALATDGTLLVDVPSGGATVTLPVAATNNGKILIVKKVDDDTDVLTFNSAVKVTVTESFTTLNYATTLKIQSDGTNWWLIN
jgi:hypothetical protein